jgi:hypothetical protein
MGAEGLTRRPRVAKGRPLAERAAARALAELATVPPRDFSRAREAMAARLAKSGQSGAASAVRKVKRPTVPVWIVNRLAREEAPTVEQLIKTADRMRAAQISRARDTDALTRDGRAHRAALSHLLGRASAMLARAGVGAPHRVLLRIENTLATAAADPASQAALRQGWLDRELTARGFEVFGPAEPRRAPTRAPRRGAKGSEERKR